MREDKRKTGTPKGSASAARQRHILGLHHSALPLEMLWKPFSSGLFHFSHGKCALTPDLVSIACCKVPATHHLVSVQNNTTCSYLQELGTHFMSSGIWLSWENHSLKHRPRYCGRKAVTVPLDQVISTPRTCRCNTYWPGSALWSQAAEKGSWETGLAGCRLPAGLPVRELSVIHPAPCPHSCQPRSKRSKGQGLQ